MKIYKTIYRFFDKLEDKVRGGLTHHPIIYALIGSIGTVSIWRGIWEISDNLNIPSWVSLFGGVALSMLVGLLVSFFVGDNIIISGLKQEKRTDEKTEEDIAKEEITLEYIQKEIKSLKEIILKDQAKKEESKK